MKNPARTDRAFKRYLIKEGKQIRAALERENAMLKKRNAKNVPWYSRSRAMFSIELPEPEQQLKNLDAEEEYFKINKFSHLKTSTNEKINAVNSEHKNWKQNFGAYFEKVCGFVAKTFAADSRPGRNHDQ